MHRHARHPVRGDRLADAVAVRVFADQRPAVAAPRHRLQMHDAPVCAFVLEMQEPVFPLRGLHPAALVRPVDGTLRRSHHDAFFVRTVRTFSAKHRLPAGLDAARRCKNVVAPVPLVEFGPFDGRLRLVPVVHDPGRPQQPRSVGRHRSHEHHALEPGPRPGGRMRKPGPAVLVPERTGIDETLGLHHPDRIFPAPARILGPDHENPPVRIAAENIEPAVMIADGRRPDAVSMLHAAMEIRIRPVPIGPRIIAQRRTGQLPVDQIAGMQDRQPRKTVERRGRHIVVLPHPADIRVAVIRVQHGIGIAGLRRQQQRTG